MSNLDFAVGKRVVHIGGGTGRQISGPACGASPKATPERGCIYTIREIFDNRDGYIGFHLEEIVNRPDSDIGLEPCFNSARFRPVRETSIDCFTAFLEKPPVKQREDA